MSSQPVLTLKGITKQFVGVKALDGVDFDVRPGEVHALMGENGAGKSTLIKVMTGVYTPDGGVIEIGGKPISPRSPDDAVKHGISTVYQEVNLVPNLSVAENICLGREPKGPLGIKWGALYRHAEAAVARLGLQVDVRRSLGSISIAMQQMVAIARALDVSAKVLVLDEPTSSLDQSEVEQLFQAIRSLKDQGLGIVFVTHFLDQVYEVSDRITVLRNGALVGTWDAVNLPRLQLVSNMIGRDASGLERISTAKESQVGGEVVASAKKLGRKGAIENVDFQLPKGSILGLAGLLGSGRTETIRLMFGLDHPDEGEYQLHGKSANRLSPREAIRRGVAICAEDRKLEGIFPELTIRENVMIAVQAKSGWLRLMPMARQKQLATEMTERLKVRPPDIDRPIGLLSGGNQQKVLLARWLAVGPDLLLLDEPTRGIDVGAKFEIMELIEQLRKDGMSFVFVSSELSEVVRAANEVLVMRDRRAVMTLAGSDVSEKNIVDAIAGGTA
jgi:simple sugar transport system ATP-binding protein